MLRRDRGHAAEGALHHLHTLYAAHAARAAALLRASDDRHVDRRVFAFEPAAPHIAKALAAANEALEARVEADFVGDLSQEPEPMRGRDDAPLVLPRETAPHYTLLHMHSSFAAEPFEPLSLVSLGWRELACFEGAPCAFRNETLRREWSARLATPLRASDAPPRWLVEYQARMQNAAPYKDDFEADFFGTHF